MDYKVGTTVFDDWHIIGELGGGAYGKVYEIQKNDFGITTFSALKVITIPHSSADIVAALNEGMDEEMVTTYFRGFVDEILQEIEVMASLKGHPNIVTYEDHKIVQHPGKMGWDILIKMELLTSLQEFQRNNANLDESLVIHIAENLCSALTYCQQKNMVHRDIKPENIFVNDSGQFKLGDFGIARTIEKTSGGLSKKGTESYMAPEVYLNDKYGTNVDIYSLGVVLYRLMNKNRLPFYPPAPQPISYSQREQALAKRMSGEKLPPPCAASPDFAEIILKACEFKPEDRYHTAAEMLAELQRLSAPMPDIAAAGIRHSAHTPSADSDECEKTTGAFSNIPTADEYEKTTGAFSNTPTADECEKTTGAFSNIPASDECDKTTGVFSSTNIKTDASYTNGVSGKWTCKRCGATNNASAQVCEICGYGKNGAGEESQYWTCKFCNGRNKYVTTPGQYCAHCGKPREGDSSEQQVPCPNCGQMTPNGENCAHCGSTLNRGAQPKTQPSAPVNHIQLIKTQNNAFLTPQEFNGYKKFAIWCMVVAIVHSICSIVLFAFGAVSGGILLNVLFGIIILVFTKKAMKSVRSALTCNSIMCILIGVCTFVSCIFAGRFISAACLWPLILGILLLISVCIVFGKTHQAERLAIYKKAMSQKAASKT